MALVQHVTVFRQPGLFAGWPANYGIWSYPGEAPGRDEIVVGFTVGTHLSARSGHARDKEKPFTTMLARSKDGGESWEVGPFTGRTPGDRGLSADEHVVERLSLASALADPSCPNVPVDPPGGLDLCHPDLAILCARTGLHRGVRSFYYASLDRCRTFAGPYWLPDWGQPGIAARTSYTVDGPHQATFFLTANKQSDGEEGRVLCARTEDGGRSFAFRAWVGPEPDGFAIMPAGIRLSANQMLCAVRCRAADRARAWIDLYRSTDDGRTWRPLARPVIFRGQGHGGNPPTLSRLRDGRLCLTYGDRGGPPYRMCARLSADDGASWGEEIVLRADGGSPDLGYPRTVVRGDGAVVTVYYWNDRPDGDGERYIAATIWRPN